MTEERFESTGNYDNWRSTYNHLVKYFEENITFKNFDGEKLKSFKIYLDSTATTPQGKPLSANTK